MKLVIGLRCSARGVLLAAFFLFGVCAKPLFSFRGTDMFQTLSPGKANRVGFTLIELLAPNDFSGRNCKQ
jgi:hypothetical protein